MTYAPQTLKDARAVVRHYTGLSLVEVGITPDPVHNGGYHCGWDQRRIVNGKLSDYSWNESPRDFNHKSDAASALDVGWFTQLVDGRKLSLIDFNKWLVRELDAGAPDTLDIREFIYTLDGQTVKRWDRLGKRTTGDSSHLQHSHISRFRDAENNIIAPLFMRFFANPEEEMKTKLVTAINGDGRIWLSNGLVRIHVADHDDTDQNEDNETVLRDTRWIHGSNVLGTLINGDIDHVGDLDAWGKELPAELAEDLKRVENKLDTILVKLENLETPGAGSYAITGGRIDLGPVE